MKIGDTVRLRSGGPIMTIVAYKEADAGYVVTAKCWLEHLGRWEALELPEPCFEPVQIWASGKITS